MFLFQKVFSQADLDMLCYLKTKILIMQQCKMANTSKVFSVGLFLGRTFFSWGGGGEINFLLLDNLGGPLEGYNFRLWFWGRGRGVDYF